MTHGLSVSGRRLRDAAVSLTSAALLLSAVVVQAAPPAGKVTPSSSRRVAAKGGRSRFIDRAVLHYVQAQGKQNLRKQLEVGYRANAASDLEMAAEWFRVEEEALATVEGMAKPKKTSRAKKA